MIDAARNACEWNHQSPVPRCPPSLDPHLPPLDGHPSASDGGGVTIGSSSVHEGRRRCVTTAVAGGRSGASPRLGQGDHRLVGIRRNRGREAVMHLPIPSLLLTTIFPRDRERTHGGGEGSTVHARRDEMHVLYLTCALPYL